MLSLHSTLEVQCKIFIQKKKKKKKNTLIVSFTLQPVGLGLFTAPSAIVPSLHRLKPSIYKLFKPLASFSYAI